MAWRKATEDDLKRSISETEVEAYREAANDSGDDRIAELLTRTTRLVRRRPRDGLDRRGAARQFAVRDRHRTISLTATVAEGVTDDDVPEVGDVFRAPVAGREVAFVCQSCELETFVEDASVLTLTGRTPGETPANAPWLPRTPPPVTPPTISDAPAETHN